MSRKVGYAMSEYLTLFTTFFKLGGFTFGGGYAMLPLIQKEIVEKHKWASEEEIMDYYAVAQCTPGVIAVNVATFVGFYRKGILGAIIATFGVIFPSLIIIMLIASLLQNFAQYPIVQHALAGIQIAVCVLVFQAIIKLAKNGIRDQFGWCVFGAVLLLSYFTSVSTVMIVVLAGISGIVMVKLRKGASA